MVILSEKERKSYIPKARFESLFLWSSTKNIFKIFNNKSLFMKSIKRLDVKGIKFGNVDTYMDTLIN